MRLKFTLEVDLEIDAAAMRCKLHGSEVADPTPRDIALAIAEGLEAQLAESMAFGRCEGRSAISRATVRNVLVKGGAK